MSNDLYPKKIFPEEPGIYIMKDSEGKVLYVGKAKSLRKRLSSYFQKNIPDRVSFLMNRVEDIETIVTDNETEALLLEYNLIKKYKPRYNIHFRDDKKYPYIKITNEEYPKIIVSRKVDEDGAFYFGPYSDVGSARRMLALARNIFKIRSCKKMGNRPCLNYYIKRCSAPCSEEISKETYRDSIKDLLMFFDNKGEELISKLTKEMEINSKELEFEKAAILRDKIDAIRKSMEQQKIFLDSPINKDVIGYYDKVSVCICIIMVRNGVLTGTKNFPIEDAIFEKEETLSSFLKQHYIDNFLPSKIILPFDIPERGEIQKFLSSKEDNLIITPASTVREKEEVLLATKNAELFLSSQKKTPLEGLRESLGLENIPRRIEGYDISNIGPELKVGSQVTFIDGKPSKENYRIYKIKTVAGQDDISSLREVLNRRLKHTEFLPDLILIDGGKGHLNTALSVLKSERLEIPTVALAKQEEDLYTEDGLNPKMEPDSKNLLIRVRDEAHRFAIKNLRNMKRKTSMSSPLDGIAGLGPKKKALLLEHFESIDNLKKAKLEEIESVVRNKELSEMIFNKIKNMA
ncbi:MAG: excinuclease ABC subunit C [Candidatus Methanofastidiosum methylothiophilum]|uniref:UvrABC system protein C n=1 Tax=Candidatus Methanofastidiosum methylothiophilum TaxID=1705564 RepID=A0A150J6R2_9EURY|nr:MAG: excinuclease ABC subunit C [Candidatus Methanofastidiosum methylthiophilus]